jgi:tRNA (cytidine/uridine-2'-O-)-methyltransferase
MSLPPAIHIALLAPEIPWNTGNVGRTALAVGARLHLIKPLGFSIEDRYLKRAGLDYWPDVSPVIWPSFSAFEENLPTMGIPYFFTGEAPCSMWQTTFARQTVLIFGAESVGLPPDVRRKYSEQCVSIPMQRGPVRSLNLSTSAALAAYEVWRQHGLHAEPG